MSFYEFARSLVVALSRLRFRVVVLGGGHVPPQGAYIVAPSHRSVFDIPFAALVTDRKLRFLAKDQLFATKPGKKLFEALGAIEVERGSADRGALRALERALRDGEPVVVFPEGTRREGPQIAQLFDGAGFLAVKLGVPVVPVGIAGAEAGHNLSGGWRRHPVAVVVGEPIEPPALEGRARRRAAMELTTRLHQEMQRCYDAARRHVE